MTQWHLDWQERWPEHQREFVIGVHRADICTVPAASLLSTMIGLRLGEPLVVEFQHSYLAAEEIEEREEYYEKAAGQMIWVWDARKACDAGRLFTSSRDSRRFTWKYFRSSLSACRCPAFLDLGGSLLFVRRWPRKEWIEDWDHDGGPDGTWSNGRYGWGDGSCEPVNTKEFARALTIKQEGR